MRGRCVFRHGLAEGVGAVRGVTVPVIAFGPLQILHATPPKTGSTTALAAYMALAGFGPCGAGRVRAVMRQAQADGRAQAAGLALHHVPVAGLPAFYAERAGWRRVCTLRSPYDRAVSNWHSKLNRYAWRFDRRAYVYGKMLQLLGGPEDWPHVERANAHMQRRIPFVAMLEGLVRHGTGFDGHFEQQAVLLALGQVRYDHMIRLEDFAGGFEAALRAMGADAGRIAVPHRNRRETGEEAGGLVPDARAVALIARAYGRDVALLGYGPPLRMGA